MEPDGNNFIRKLFYAVQNDEESERIAQNGAALAKTVLSDNAIDCFWALVAERYLRLFVRFRRLCENRKGAASIPE